VWERQSPICSSYFSFTKEMRRVFDHRVCGKDAAKRLLSVKAIEFRTLATESGWNEEALQGAFQ
jgi:hypothetical protein